MRIAAIAVAGWVSIAVSGSAGLSGPRFGGPEGAALHQLERPRVVAAANPFLTRAPQTITAFRASRSAGGPNDFFSEGDYWWPDPAKPGGPLLFGGLALGETRYVDLWRTLQADSEVEEVVRNFFIRQPVLWLP